MITAAPHTSNWDAVLGFAAILGINVRLHWLGKHSIFLPGLRWFMRWLGGIPVNRKNPEAVMGYVNDAVSKHEGVVIIVAPEGTRKKAKKWKTGFLRIAEANDCVIQLGALDFPNKRIVLGKTLSPQGTTKLILKVLNSGISSLKANTQISFRHPIEASKSE